MSAQIIVFVSVSCVLIIGISAQVTYCKSDKDCKLNEVCDKDSCQCDRDHVRYLNKCFPVKIHGEQCSYDVQCNDDRMICANEEYDMQQKRFCVCDTYHLWNSTIGKCVGLINVTQIAGNFREAYNVTGMIEKSAQKVFLGVVIAGLIFVCILLSFIGICSVYGCCTKHKKGRTAFGYIPLSKKTGNALKQTDNERYGKNDLGKELIDEVAVIGLPQGTYEAIETDFPGFAAI